MYDGAMGDGSMMAAIFKIHVAESLGAYLTEDD